MDAEDFAERLERVTSRFGEDNDDALRHCDDILEDSIRQNFEKSQTARGEPWPQRKDPTLGHPLLILEGDLKVAATYTRGEIREGKTLIRRMKPGTTGTSLAGQRRHEFGDELVLGREGILARPYFGVSSEAADLCADKVAGALVDQIIQGLM